MNESPPNEKYLNDLEEISNDTMAKRKKKKGKKSEGEKLISYSIQMILIIGIIYSFFALVGDLRTPLPIIPKEYQQLGGLVLLLLLLILYKKLYG